MIMIQRVKINSTKSGHMYFCLLLLNIIDKSLDYLSKNNNAMEAPL